MLDILFQFLDSTKQKLCFWTKGAAVLRKDRKIENQSGLLWACSILIKPVCHHFTSNNNVAALWSKMKESLAKQCGCLLVPVESLLLAWCQGKCHGCLAFPQVMYVYSICVCVWVFMSTMETDVVLPHLFCCHLFNFLFSPPLSLSYGQFSK